MEHLPHILEHPTVLRDGAPVPESRRAVLPGILPGAAPDVPDDLRGVSTRRLRIICNHAYQLLDHDCPSAESRERYEAVVEELEWREAHAEQPTAEGPPSRFRDTAVVITFMPGALRRRLRRPGAARAAGRDRR